MIRIKGVSKRFKDVVAVNNLSLDIDRGEFLALLGPNGAGKTTLVEMIEGLQQPDSGEISVNGMNWRRHSAQIRRILGLSLQETRFIDKLTVKEILILFSSFYDLPKSRALEIMELVNLGGKANAFSVHLSGGQRQKLALGIALLNDPEILILDEPTTGLDPNARREIWRILEGLKRKKNTTLILTTHYMEEAENLCDRIVILDHGKILAQGVMKDLLMHFAGGEIISFTLSGRPADEKMDHLKGLLECRWLNESRGMLVVDEIAKTLPVFLEMIRKENLDLIELESRKRTLDDLFVSLTGRRLHD